MASRTKSRSHTSFRCTDCGQVTPVWNGRCNGCEGWNTLEATVASAVPLAQVSALRAAPTPVGIGEVDRVLGGGLVPGSVTLLSGPPGVGESTLSLQLAAGSSSTVLYVAAEETVAQVRLRADRLGVRAASSLLVTERGDVDQIVAAMTDARPDLVIIDSIQAVHDPSIESTAGSVAQVRACAQRLAAVARETGTALVIVGHVTKDGSIAGPRLLEHLVDTVVTFDADLDHALRFLRAIKHRFGPVGELGVFTMGSDGLNGVPDVGAMFLEGRRRGVPGSVVTPVTEGRRSLVVEVQALVDASGSGGVRVCQGVERGRVELIRAVLARRIGIDGDVYVSVAGGFSVTEPAADLALALAVTSAATGVAVDPTVVVCGELGLVGEVRGVAAVEQRLTEAARLGFDRAIVPAVTPETVQIPGMTLQRVGDVAEAVASVTDRTPTIALVH